MSTATQRDRYDLPLSTPSSEAADQYRQGQECVLAHGINPGAFFETAIAADPEFALAHAALAQVRLRELRLPEARAGGQQAVTLAEKATPREQQHAAAIAAVTRGQGALAIDRMREHLRTFPRDALLLNSVVTSLLFAGRQDEMVQVTEAATPAYAADDWFYLGLHAFALQEVRRFEEARFAAQRSLEMYPLAAFTTHALAHVFYELGEYDAGAGFMPGWLAGYDRRGGLHLHLAWHLALFLLARGQYAAVFALYERQIQPAAQPGSFNLYDPVSLLWRADAYTGIPQPKLWTDVAAIAAERAASPGMVFADLHHGMALAATHQSAKLAALLDSFRARGDRGNAVAGDVALPLMQGLIAFAEQNYVATVAFIEPIEDRIYQVGGSKAQREVFHDTLLEALLRAGRFEAAERRLRERLDRRPSPRDFYRLGRARAAAGETVAAREALTHTLTLWSAADSTAAEPAAARGLAARLAQG